MKQYEVKMLDELTEWIENQKVRSEFAAEVTFPIEKWISLLCILEQNVESLHTLLNHGIGRNHIHNIAGDINRLNEVGDRD